MRIPSKWIGSVAGLTVWWTAAAADAAVWRVPVDFPTVSAALSAAAAGDTVQIVGNGGSTYPERLVIDKDVTLEGGWRADFAFRDPSLYVSVLRDTTDLFQRSIVRVDGSPAVTFDGLWFIAGRLGVEATDGADLTFRDCLFRSQRNERNGFGDQPGGALHMTGGSLVMERTTVRNIITSFPGGGIGLDGVTSAVIRDSRIEQCNTRPFVQGITKPAPGGGLWARDVPDLQLDRVNLLQCAAQFHGGGGLYAENTGVTAVACSVSQAFAGDEGGGMQFLNCPAVDLTACVVEESFGTDGGGLHVDGIGAFTMNGCSIRSNRTTGEGGGLWMKDAAFTFQNSEFAGNNLAPSTVPVRGGGVWSLNSSG
ncbi:MAG: hypothetical protein HKN12_03175, partial [Gemmatimonadetes bacterium]|nr:hypothetical protein [Gemmatimonadota bacterium]